MAAHSILIIDDEPNQRFVLEQALRAIAGDWEILAVGSAAEALLVIDRRVPDLIITDYNMPMMNGLELVAIVRDRKLTVPIILMTAYSSPEVTAEAARLGVNHYLTKPVPIAKLRQLTTTTLSSGAASAA